MSGTTARVQLISNALLLLGDSPISSLTDGTTGALLGANLFDNTYLSMLQDHRWRFAIKTQLLSRLSAKPNTGYAYAFQLPSDMLTVVKGDSGNFEIYETEIHSNSSTFQLDYVYRVAEDMFPPYFAQALEYSLAAKFAIPITGDVEKGKYFATVYLNEIRKAKATDSQQYPEVEVQHQPYVTVRS